ncbi:hypothetical protein CFD26_102736 [Aspergillus turcosus]|uniref:Catalase core domain-containing protein n=1 Tax=Aspergillus turcosus TaxID=1245748 RepID=A0A3R7J2Y4_9EURO|nr:hypothetical protein CFD26_102736 [Aspergillus turcosus]
MAKPYYTLAEGCPVASDSTSVQLRNQRGGLLLLQDTQLIETLTHFNRERIPERVVHAKAAGCASFLSEVGKTTPLLVRISTVGPEAGSADTVRDVHGWSMKMYTDEGNLDWVFNNTDGSFKYVKVHIKSTLGIKNFTAEESLRVAAENPDYHIQDLFEAIDKGDHPEWNVYVQVMTPEEAEKYRWNIFDMTKVWPHGDFPLRQIGKIRLNRNPKNYFTDIEQAAFSPSNMVPGIAPSADPVLQARMFAYPDAARYRVGTNYQQLPTNAAKAPVHCPYQRDGQMNFSDNYGSDPNYVGSSLKPMTFYQDVSSRSQTLSTITEHEKWVGEVCSFQHHITDDDFVQPRELWKVIGREPGHQERFFGNVAGHLSKVKSEKLRNAVYAFFSKIDPGLGEGVKKATEDRISA